MKYSKLGNKGETAVETPAMGRSRNLEEQALKETQASSPCLKAGGSRLYDKIEITFI
ncbi:MAG: hypothetical protein LBD29_08215 [Treponema sp.]|nr:hypothetical protein [Treponema sp.]